MRNRDRNSSNRWICVLCARLCMFDVNDNCLRVFHWFIHEYNTENRQKPSARNDITNSNTPNTTEPGSCINNKLRIHFDENKQKDHSNRLQFWFGTLYVCLFVRMTSYSEQSCHTQYLHNHYAISFDFSELNHILRCRCCYSSFQSVVAVAQL